MTWQELVDTQLVGRGLAEGAIVSAAGDSAWAATKGLQLKPEEMKTLADIVNGVESVVNNAHGNGIYIMGQKHTYMGSDFENMCYARQSDVGGVMFRKTKQAIVVAIHKNDQYFDVADKDGKRKQVQMIRQNATEPVHEFAKYLEGTGY